MLGFGAISELPLSTLPATTSGVTGTVAYTNANDTLAASGTTTIVGTLAKTNANDTSAASGSPIVNGAVAYANNNDTLAASGSVGSSVSGTVAYTNANDTLSASGTTTVTGTVARTNANDTGAASGTTTVTGTLVYTNINDSVSASGAAGAVTGTVSYTNNNDTAAATGTAATGGDTHDGWWADQWRKKHKKKPLPETVEEAQALVTEVIAKAKKKTIDLPKAIVLPDNTAQQIAIAETLIDRLRAMQDEDDIEALLLML